MVLIRFTKEDAKRRAVEFLIGDHPFKSWKTGEMLVPEETLALLARQNIPFVFEGLEAYDALSPLRDPAAAAV